MPDLTRTEVQALLDGATPGRWEPDVELRMVVAPSPSGECFGYVAKDVAALGDVALLAAAPQLAKQLLDALGRLALLGDVDHAVEIHNKLTALSRAGCCDDAVTCSYHTGFDSGAWLVLTELRDRFGPKDGTDGQ